MEAFKCWLFEKLRISPGKVTKPINTAVYNQTKLKLKITSIEVVLHNQNLNIKQKFDFFFVNFFIDIV